MSDEISELTEIREQAIQWVLDLSSIDISDKDRERFQSWLEADARHQGVYQQAEKVWMDLANLDAAPELSGLEWRMEAPKVKRSGASLAERLAGFLAGLMRPAAVAVTAMLMVSVTVLLLYPFDSNQAVRQYANNHGQMTKYNLQDGSDVALGALSSFDISFTEHERRVVLKAGDAFFSVAADPQRPFVIQVGNTSVRVLGTRFDVHKGPREARVSVEEGVVEVLDTSSGSDSAKLTLKAGQKVIASRSGTLGAIQSIAIDEVGTWREGRLNYEETSLAEIVADANRYCDMKIILVSEALGDRKLTTSFRTEQCEQMLEGIASALSLEVVRTEQGPLLLK